ncbi:MAG: nucleotidyltransferase family protein, partial [Actinomycetota bacterium]|nr:nucleotidyltransferase family protein [Actinomycetota bacterium]
MIPPQRIEALRRLALDAATAEVVRALSGAGITSILIKGAAIAAWLYDDPSQRSYCDADLLIEPERFDRAEAVLRELGFDDPMARAHPDERTVHASTWSRTQPLPGTIDLHRCLYWCADDPELLWRELSVGTGAMTIAGAEVQTLSAAAQLLVIAAHAVQHGEHPQPLEDLERAVRRAERGQWEGAARIALALGAPEVLDAGLRRCSLGRELAGWLDLPQATSTLMQLRIAGARPTSAGFERLARTRSPREALALLARELCPSPAFMR